MEITVIINKCSDCRHRDHSGAFTPGGARYICQHPMAVKYMGKGTTENRYRWQHREIKDPEVIPEKCPLKNGEKY